MNIDVGYQSPAVLIVLTLIFIGVSWWVAYYANGWGE